MPERLPDVNLLPTFKKPRESTPYFIIISMLIVLLLFIFLGVHYFMTKSKLQVAENEHNELQEEIDRLQVDIDAKRQDESEGPTLANAVNFAEGHHIPTSIFIEELFDLLPENSYFSEYTYRANEANIEVHVETLDTVAQYTAQLKGSPYVTDTKVNTVETFTLKDEDIDPFEEIPRYEAQFTLLIDPLKLKEAERDDE
ncbi:MAG TPA: PilN domain-containing protein [Bacillota bacterium]|nr:PilN domain-containing protein [Bacillota bacterium]